jgi:hypothetical protein
MLLFPFYFLWKVRASASGGIPRGAHPLECILDVIEAGDGVDLAGTTDEPLAV